MGKLQELSLSFGFRANKSGGFLTGLTKFSGSPSEMEPLVDLSLPNFHLTEIRTTPTFGEIRSASNISLLLDNFKP
jgi:hypothetical protein